MLAERTRESMMGATGATSCKWSHAREAARDVKIYLFFRALFLPHWSRAKLLTRDSQSWAPPSTSATVA